MHQKPLQRAVEICQGQTALAQKIGTSQALVWFWLNRAKRIPPRAAIDIEAATDGQVTRHQLCPDVFPETGEAA